MTNAATITNIQGFSLHDGPGIRTVVFFKGCPLSCQWCANPECISAGPQVGFFQSLCKGCGKCFETCTEQAICLTEGAHRIDYLRCTGCGRCSDHCSYGALVRYGASMTIAEVWDAVRRDKMFYETSGGGVTVSGGEPLLWGHFVRELFELCREDNISTCIETCGLAAAQSFLDLLPATDHFLFDLKHMNSDIHRKYTGRPNSRILENAALLVERGADVCFRQPVIPGVNDSIDNIDATAAFLTGFGRAAARLQLMPYHRMGHSKYKALSIPCTLEETASAEDAHVEMIQKAYISRGVACTISR